MNKDKIIAGAIAIVAVAGVGIAISQIKPDKKENDKQNGVKDIVVQKDTTAEQNDIDDLIENISFTGKQNTIGNPIVEKNLTTWNCIYFGNYYQDDTNGDGEADKNDDKVPIKWRVLSIDESNNTALLLSDKGLSERKYEDGMRTSWEESDLREWLNGNFYDNAFSESDKNSILVSAVSYNMYEKNGRDENNENIYSSETATTNDKIRLLSRGEIKEEYGFTSLDTLVAVPTELCKGPCGVTDSSGRWGCYWWILDLAKDGYETYVVCNDGEIDHFPIDAGAVSVRPVILVDLNSATWAYAGTVDSKGNKKQ